MKRNHLHALLLLATLLFVSCETEETYQVQDVSYADKSELYGIWRWKDSGMRVTGYDPLPIYYVLGDSASFYLEGGVVRSGRASYRVGNIEWEFGNERSIGVNLDWGSLFANAFHVYSVDKSECGFSYNDITYCAFTVSNVDSLNEAIMKFGVDRGAPLYTINAPSYVVASDVVDKNKQRFLRTVTESCYQANADASTLENLCEVTEFQKVEMPELAQILANVDTLSSTEIWQVLEAEAANNQN